LNQEVYRKLISGQSVGINAALLRFLLYLSAAGYSCAVRLRNFLYSSGWLKINRVNAIVISVGNITTGGTGKTPLVIWLCNCLRQRTISCAVLTRGYKTHEGIHSDEPAIFIEDCPQAKVVVNPDRVDGAVEAINKFGAKVLIMDDGFQHRRLARDIDVITIDATLPFGYGKLLPAGLLREPVSELKRADAIVITRCNQITETKLIELEKNLRETNPNMIIARSMHAPVYAKSAESKEIGLERLKGKRVFVFCGIGNPNAFLETITEQGCELAGSKVYNDHYYYAESDVLDIYKQAESLKAGLILTTQKDWTKVAPLLSKVQSSELDIQFTYVKIEIKFVSGEEKLRVLINKALSGKIPPR
jgi:tetraacyldisaccharide 4'-kinase